MLTRTIVYSENTSNQINQDSIQSLTASEIKYANLIFAEHKSLLTENTLLKEQLINFEELNCNLLAVDTLRQVQLIEYKQLNNEYLNQINDLNLKLKKNNNKLAYWKIGGITISVALILALIFK
jgi:hypothetical protein